MDALVKKDRARGLVLTTVDKPEVQDGFALVKILKTAICGTDLHIYGWDEWSQNTIKTPQIIGHEFVGIVEEIKGTGAFKAGDLVSAEGHIVCKNCRNCRSGRETFCRNTVGIGVNCAGVFAPYALIPVTNLWHVSGKLDKNVLAILDPLGNACHTALSFSLLSEDVLVTGAGPIGIMAAAVAHYAGARNVVITDIIDYRLELAKKVCPSVVAVNSANEKLSAVMKRLDIVEGFDVGMEMSGNASAFNDMIGSMVTGGKIALLGIHKGSTAIDWNKVVFGSLTIKGIYGREMYDGWYKMNAMLESGLDISKIITHEFHYTEFEKAFELGLSGKCGKIVLNWQ